MPNDLVETMRREIRLAPTTEASLFGPESEDKEQGKESNIRRGRIGWVPHIHWAFALCYYYGMLANEDNFRYDLTGICDNGIQYTSYEVGDHYNWHTDTLRNTVKKPDMNRECSINDTQRVHLPNPIEIERKLSFSFILSDPSEYEGGHFEIESNPFDPIVRPEQKKGEMIIFDSRVKHRVTPVTKGRRESLVGWFVGPEFR